MLTRIHASHIGGEACYRQARDTLYWPNMQNEIKDFVSHCSACNEYAQAQQKEPMMSHVLPTRPWQIVSMDLLNYAGKDFLLIVDHYSDFWEIELLPDLSADTTIRRCKVQFARYGQPDRVISDNGPQFACEQFRRFSADWGFEHVTSSPRHPQANGKAESAVKIVKNICKKAKYDGTDPWKAVLHWRNTPSEGMDSSPAQRLMSRRLKTLLPVANKLLEPCVVTGVLEKLRRRKQIAKLSYDVSAKDLPELSIGEPIRMKPLPGDRTGRWRLGSCVQRVAPRSYLVDVDGSLYRRNRVALRRAERLPIQAYVPPARAPPEVLNAPGPHPQSGGNTAVLSEGYIENDIIQPHVPSSLSVPNTPARREGGSVSMPTGAARPSPGKISVALRSGRVSRPPDRLNL
uniref:Gypsy retrotransposon integrase-like protein 1 n=1 Tax=Leptobrachium leishanense TaxID=445787 RepID=A0A8C5MJX5_9ANUR